MNIAAWACKFRHELPNVWLRGGRERSLRTSRVSGANDLNHLLDLAPYLDEWKSGLEFSKNCLVISQRIQSLILIWTIKDLTPTQTCYSTNCFILTYCEATAWAETYYFVYMESRSIKTQQLSYVVWI